MRTSQNDFQAMFQLLRRYIEVSIRELFRDKRERTQSSP